MANEADLRVAKDLVLNTASACDFDLQGVLVEVIATALTTARAETWEKAIMFVNIADIGDAKGADATYKIGKMLEAATGSKTKVFGREDEQKNSENQESVK